MDASNETNGSTDQRTRTEQKRQACIEPASLSPEMRAEVDEFFRILNLPMGEVLSQFHALDQQRQQREWREQQEQQQK
jgi:hypothetical protein